MPSDVIMKITENPLANTATQPQVGVILESSTPVFTCQENQFTKIGNDPDITTIGIMALHIGEGNTVIRKNTFSGISIGNLSNGINGFWPSTGLLYECNENYDVTWRDFSVLAGYIKSLQGHSINPNEFISAGNRFSQIATDYSCFIQQPDTNVTRKVRYHFYIYDQNQDPQVLEGNIVKFASEHDNPCESTICDPRCLDETELEQAKIEYYLNKTVYESLYVEYAASPTEQEEPGAGLLPAPHG
ncbi:MAG: hypothetical protein IPH12_17725 [Saprospirales bacterium]|nr:hypothetical protein [Saprospirales bacterium]